MVHTLFTGYHQDTCFQLDFKHYVNKLLLKPIFVLLVNGWKGARFITLKMAKPRNRILEFC